MIYNLKCAVQLGDSIFNINFLNKYHSHDYIFNYYVYNGHITELRHHIYNKNIILHDITTLNVDAYDMWIGHNVYFFDEIKKYDSMFDIFYLNFFKKVSKELNLEVVTNDTSDVLYHIYNIYDVQTIHTEYDYLIINSIPLSGQCEYDDNIFVDLCNNLISKNYKIITTKKINNIECTLDYNYNLLDIGLISNKCENIIAINTSPIITTFNNINISKNINRYIIDWQVSYSYNNMIHQIKDLKKLKDMIF